MVNTVMRIPIDADQRARRPGNQVDKVRWFYRPSRVIAAFFLGTILSTAFAPCEYSWVVWVGLVPLMYLSFCPNSRPWILGYAFGFGHFVTTFGWLREVFILAPVGVAGVCALFPALWLLLSKCLLDNLQISKGNDLLPRNDPGVNVYSPLSPSKIIVLILASSSIWCGLEWCRSWFFSGFPWNQLGISQWQNHFLLPAVSFAGVYAISFLIATVNITIFLFFSSWTIATKIEERPRPAISQNFGFLTKNRNFKHFARERLAAGFYSVTAPPYTGIWILAPALVGFTLVGMVQDGYKNSTEPEILKIAAVQGNIPQSRHWSPEQLDLALEVYTSLTRQVVKETNPDLVVWPETAIPASLTYNQRCFLEMQQLFGEVDTPLLAGSITYRFLRGAKQEDAPPQTFNSALLFNKSGHIIDHYDKIHLVPFGEFVPFEDFLPWLVEWIGMGRSLTAGREYTVFPFLNGTKIGVNICFEDIFPEISAKMVRSGANLLLIITNDAWFGHTSGSRQHLAHTVFRAVENFRPVLRNGNNSDTCLILPTGEVTHLLYDSQTGNRFVRKAQPFLVPVWRNPSITFYTQYGNWLAILCFVITITCALWCYYRFLDRKRRLYEAIRPEEIES